MGDEQADIVGHGVSAHDPIGHTRVGEGLVLGKAPRRGLQEDATGRGRIGRIGRRAAGQDRAAVVECAAVPGPLFVAAIAHASRDLELVSKLVRGIGEHIVRGGAAVVLEGLAMDQLQRAEGSRRVDGVDRRDVRRREAEQAGQGRRGPSGKHALIVLKRHRLGPVLVKISHAGKGAQTGAAIVVDAEFLAVLVAPSVLREDEERKGEAVRVEHFQRLEPAKRGDGRQPERIAELVSDEPGDAPGGPLQAEITTACEAIAGGQRRAGILAQIAKNTACQGIGWEIGQRFERCPGGVVLLVVEDQIRIETVVRAPFKDSTVCCCICRIEVPSAEHVFNISIARLDAACQTDGEGRA